MANSMRQSLEQMTQEMFANEQTALNQIQHGVEILEAVQATFPPPLGDELREVIAGLISIHARIEMQNEAEQQHLARLDKFKVAAEQSAAERARAFGVFDTEPTKAKY